MTLKLNQLIFLAIAALIVIISCDSKQSVQDSVELDDSLKKVIVNYVQENNVDLKSKVITTRWVSSSYRTDIYISNLNSQLYKTPQYAPIYYSVIDENIIVFIYTGVEKYISRNANAIVRELDETLLDHSIELRPDSGYFYSAPTWLYTFCETEDKLIKKLPPLQYNFIPCGYTLMQDIEKKDSLYIVKDRFDR